MIMRKNPYEKIRRTLFILLVILLVSAACVMGVMLIKNTHNAEKNKVRETTAGTENATEKIKETEADTDYWKIYHWIKKNAYQLSFEQKRELILLLLTEENGK